MAFRYTFQHFVDISTSSNSVNIIKIKAGGEYVHKRCAHLFGTYKYWKLGKIQVKLIPASTLPVDPQGLSYSDEDPQGIDPRDQLSPGLVRITNGESIMTDLTGLSDTAQRQMYLNTMLDPRWSKFMLQSGFKRTAVPLAYDVGNLQQTVYPDSVNNLIKTAEETVIANQDVRRAGTIAEESFLNSSSSAVSHFRTGSDPRGLFQLGHRKKLGWMPTDALETWFSYESGAYKSDDVAEIVPIPEIDCITVILPKAYKTRYYYRMFITETVYFAGVKNIGNSVPITGGETEYRAFDNFTFFSAPGAVKPSRPQNIQPLVVNPNDGSGRL